MKMHLLMIVVLFLVTTEGYSQKFQGGVTGGLNAARIDGDGHERYGKLGLNAGAFVSRAVIPDLLYWQMELKYTSRGKYNIEKDATGTMIGLELIDLRYVEMPLSVHFFFDPKIQIEAGFSPHILLSDRFADENGTLPSPIDYNDPAERIRWVYGLTAFASANYFINEHFSAGIRFNYSVFPFYKYDAYAVRYRDRGYFHDVLSVNLRYYFVR